MEPELREISLKDSDTDTSHLVQNPSNADDTSQGEETSPPATNAHGQTFLCASTKSTRAQ